MRADRSRVFTVPSGIASASAISRARHPSEVGPRDQALLGIGEACQRPESLVTLDQRVLLVARGPIRHLVDQDEVRSRDTGVTAEPVDGEVVRDRHEPGGESATLGSNRAALRQAVRKTSWVSSSAASRVAEQPEPHRVDGRPEPPVERADGSIVTGKESFHQLLLLARKQRAFVSRSLHQGRSFQYLRRVRGAKFADASMVPRRSSCRHRDHRSLRRRNGWA